MSYTSCRKGNYKISKAAASFRVNLRVIFLNIKESLDQGSLRNRKSSLPIKNHRKKPQGFLKEAKTNLCEITQV